MSTIKEDTDYSKLVASKLAKASKMDTVDTVTFGLETDDGKIVKVYVAHEKSTAFEKLLSDKLGEIDSIQDVLNAVGQEDPDMIIDVEWPDTVEKDDDIDLDNNLDDLSVDAGDDEEKSDGSEALSSEIYDNPAEKADKETKIKRTESIGSLLKDKYLGEGSKMKSEDKSTRSLIKMLSTVQQKTIYNALLELGIPESVLTSGVNRTAVLNGIKAKADELETDSSRFTILKSFVKKSIQENEELSESLNKVDLKSLIDKLVMITDPGFPNRINPASPASRLVNSTSNYATFFNRLQSSGLSKLQPVAQQLSMISAKLDAIIAKSKNTTATPATIPGVNEALENDSVEVNDKWDVEVDEKVFTLKSDSLLISLDEESVEKILKALSSRKTVSVKDTIKGTLFAISSQAGGNGAIVKKSGDETTFFIKKEAIDELKKTFMAAQNIKDTEELKK